MIYRTKKTVHNIHLKNQDQLTLIILWEKIVWFFNFFYAIECYQINVDQIDNGITENSTKRAGTKKNVGAEKEKSVLIDYFMTRLINGLSKIKTPEQRGLSIFFCSGHCRILRGLEKAFRVASLESDFIGLFIYEFFDAALN